MKTYACKNATPNSRIKIKNNGIKINKDKKNSIFITFKINVTIICTKVCPANMLAANRIAKLNKRIKYEKISIGIKIGNKTNGHCGINICKNFKL